MRVRSTRTVVPHIHLPGLRASPRRSICKSHLSNTTGFRLEEGCFSRSGSEETLPRQLYRRIAAFLQIGKREPPIGDDTAVSPARI